MAKEVLETERKLKEFLEHQDKRIIERKKLWVNTICSLSFWVLKIITDGSVKSYNNGLGGY